MLFWTSNSSKTAVHVVVNSSVRGKAGYIEDGAGFQIGFGFGWTASNQSESVEFESEGRDAFSIISFGLALVNLFSNSLCSITLAIGYRSSFNFIDIAPFCLVFKHLFSSFKFELQWYFGLIFLVFKIKSQTLCIHRSLYRNRACQSRCWTISSP